MKRKEVAISISHPIFLTTPIGLIRLVKEGNRLIASLFNMADVEIGIVNSMTISTPVGKLQIDTESNDRRKALLRFPAEWSVAKEGKEDRVLDEFLFSDDGGVKPKYLFLAPMTNVDGYLVGVHPIRQENLQVRLVEDEPVEETVEV